MRSLFPGHYRPTQEEFDDLWRRAVFVFDTNVLLNMYRYAPKTREAFLEVLRGLQDRIWIPYQVADEYHRNRLRIISEQLQAYDEIEKVFDECINQIRGKRRHPSINIDGLMHIAEGARKKAVAALKMARSEYGSITAFEPIGDQVAALFEGRVGPKPSDDQLAAYHATADTRFSKLIPPGYKDAKKSPPDKYGDAVVWLQTIEYVKAEQRPLIFVTDDNKEDWWLKEAGQIVSARPELAAEIQATTGQMFYLYQPENFLTYAQNFLRLPQDEAVIEEIVEVREQEQEQRHYTADAVTVAELAASQYRQSVDEGLLTTDAELQSQERARRLLQSRDQAAIEAQRAREQARDTLWAQEQRWAELRAQEQEWAELRARAAQGAIPDSYERALRPSEEARRQLEEIDKSRAVKRFFDEQRRLLEQQNAERLEFFRQLRGTRAERLRSAALPPPTALSPDPQSGDQSSAIERQEPDDKAPEDTTPPKDSTEE